METEGISMDSDSGFTEEEEMAMLVFKMMHKKRTEVVNIEEFSEHFIHNEDYKKLFNFVSMDAMDSRKSVKLQQNVRQLMQIL